MYTINNIPCFQAVFTDEEQGMVCVSLVDQPATEIDFQVYADKTRLQKYSVVDEDRHIVRGLLMAAELPIYRYDKDYGEYYIIHSAEFLRDMAERYFKAGNQNNMDTMHNFQFEEGCDMVQMFIKDTEKGINPAGYEDIKDGSLFGEFHITNEDIWAKIKAGEYKGFSIAVLSALQPIENKQDKNTFKMSKITRFITSLMKFGEIELADGKTLFWDGEDALKEGDAVYVNDEEGNKIPAPDGEYEFDNKVATVLAGVVEVIKDKEEEPVAEPAEEPVAEEPVAEPAVIEAEDEPVAEEPVAEPEPDEKDARIAELEARVAELEAENDALKARIAELEAEPASEPVAEEYEKHTAPKNLGNSKLERAIRIASALNK